MSPDPNGRGGSRCVPENLIAGATVRVLCPGNHFPLVDAPTTGLFIAGGIGITPIIAMLETLGRAGGDWTLPCGGGAGRHWLSRRTLWHSDY